MRPPDAACEDVVRLLEAYQDGALAMPERLEFERHVAVCPSCRGYLSQIEALVRAAARLAEAGRDPADNPALLAAFRALRLQARAPGPDDAPAGRPGRRAGRHPIAYKFLGSGGVGLFSRFRWPRPEGGRPGDWVEVDDPLDPCRTGVHACGTAQLLDWVDDELWRVELGEPVLETRAGLVSARGRLVERIEAWDAAAAADLVRAAVERTRELALDALESAGRADGAAALRAAADRQALHATALDLLREVPRGLADPLGFVADAVTMSRGSMPDSTAVATLAPPTAAAVAANVAFTAARAAGRAAELRGRPGGFDGGYAAERSRQLAWLVARLGLVEEGGPS